MRFPFAQGLRDVLLQAIGFNRPRAEHGLKYQYLFVWSRYAIHGNPTAPTAQTPRPFRRHFRKYIDSGADIRATFRIMCRAGAHRVRPSSVANQVAPVEFFNAEITFRP